MPRLKSNRIVLAVVLTVGLVIFSAAVVSLDPFGAAPSRSPFAPVGGLAPDAISLGNATSISCLGVTTCTTPGLAGVQSGDTLVVIVTEHTTTAGNPSSVDEVTSGGDVALPLLGSSGCTVLGHGVVAVYGLANVTAQASVNFTVTYAGAEYYTIHALDVEGAAASPFETAGAPVCSTAAGTVASASVTTTVDNDLVILGVEVRGDEAIAGSGGDSVVTLQEIAGASSDSGSMLEESDPTTGSITLNATFASAEWAALAVALRPSPVLVAGVVSPAAVAIDASQKVDLTSTAATGGSGSYTYQWYNGSSTCRSGTLIPGATGLAYTTPALPVGTGYYCVWATDTSSHDEAYSNVAIVTVNPALAVVIHPSDPSVDSGQTITLTAEPSGGTGADSYAWYAGATCSGGALATTQAYTTSVLTAGATYCVAVTDSAYEPVTATATDSVSVSASPLGVTITPPSPSLRSGLTITLTAKPSGGTGADSYAWYAGATCSGTVLATTQAYTTAALAANSTYCVAVTDSAYEPATATANTTVTVVSSTPSSHSASPSGLTSTEEYEIGAGLAAVILALLLLLLLARRRKKEPQQPTASGTAASASSLSKESPSEPSTETGPSGSPPPPSPPPAAPGGGAPETPATPLDAASPPVSPESPAGSGEPAPTGPTADPPLSTPSTPSEPPSS